MRLALAAKCGALGCEWPAPARASIRGNAIAPQHATTKASAQSQLLSYGGFRVAIHWSANQFQVERQVTYSYQYSFDVLLFRFRGAGIIERIEIHPQRTKLARTPR